MDDAWKDDLLSRETIELLEYNSLPTLRQIWILEHKHIFYNYNGKIHNLLHKGNAELLKSLKKGNKHLNVGPVTAENKV